MVGNVVVELIIGSARCLHEMRVVRQLRHPCIVGRDVLTQIPCEISSQDGTLNFQAHQADVVTVPTEDGVALRLQRIERIPAHSEIVVWAVTESNLEHESSWLVEPTSQTGMGCGRAPSLHCCVCFWGRCARKYRELVK